MNFSKPPIVTPPGKSTCIQEYLKKEKIRLIEEKKLRLRYTQQEMNSIQNTGCALRESSTTILCSTKDAIDEKLRHIGLSTGVLRDILFRFSSSVVESPTRASVLEEVILWHAGLPVQSEHKLQLLTELIPYKELPVRTTNISITNTFNFIWRCIYFEMCLWTVKGDDWFKNISALFNTSGSPLAICLPSMLDQTLPCDIMDILIKNGESRRDSIQLILNQQEQAKNQQQSQQQQGAKDPHRRCNTNNMNGQGQYPSHDNNNNNNNNSSTFINTFLRSTNRCVNNNNNNTRNERPSNEAMFQNFTFGDNMFGSLATTTNTNNAASINNTTRITSTVVGTNNNPVTMMQQHCMPHRQLFTRK